jgi:hypothetical protein
MSTMNSHILNEAIRATAERSSTHGSVEEQFEHTAALWSAYLGFHVSSADVCQCMALLKMSRSKVGNSNVPDHYIDQTGYGALAGRVSVSNMSNLAELEKAVKDVAMNNLVKATQHVDLYSEKND